MHPRKERRRSPDGKELKRAGRIDLQHRSPVRYRLDYRGQLIDMVVLAVCIRVRWVYNFTQPYAPSVAPIGWGTPRGTAAQWRGVNQAYSRLSTTHGHITDCKLELVVYAGVCV